MAPCLNPLPIRRTSPRLQSVSKDDAELVSASTGITVKRSKNSVSIALGNAKPPFNDWPALPPLPKRKTGRPTLKAAAERRRLEMEWEQMRLNAVAAYKDEEQAAAMAEYAAERAPSVDRFFEDTAETANDDDDEDSSSESELAIEPKKSIVQKAKHTKRKATSATKVGALPPLPESDDDEVEALMPYVAPSQIPYVAAYAGKYQIKGECSATSFTDAIRSWAISCGVAMPIQGVPANMPLFAFKYASQPRTDLSSIISDERAYICTLAQAFEREKGRYELEQQGKKIPANFPSMFPLTITPVEVGTAAVQGGAGRGAGGGHGRRPSGNGPAPRTDPIDRLRAALYGQSDEVESGAYTLDKGQRNDGEIANAALGRRMRDVEVCMRDILKEYACSVHRGDESCCYVPSTGRFVGQHLRIDMGVKGELARYLGRNPDYSLKEDGLPACYRRLLERKHETAYGAQGVLNAEPPAPPLAEPIPPVHSTPNLPLVGSTTSSTGWDFQLARLNRRLTKYPSAFSVLSELDKEARGDRYKPYAAVFEKGLLLHSIGEILSWLHCEASAVKMQPEVFLLKAFKDVLSVQSEGQVAGLVNLTVPPLALLNVIVREFEREAINFEASDA